MESPFSFCPRWEKNNRNYPLPLSIWLSGFVSWYFLEPLSYPSQEKADLLTQEKRGLVQREQLKSTRPCSPEPKWRTHLTGPRNWEARKQRESAFNAHLPRNCTLKSSVENIFYFIYFFFFVSYCQSQHDIIFQQLRRKKRWSFADERWTRRDLAHNPGKLGDFFIFFSENKIHAGTTENAWVAAKATCEVRSYYYDGHRTGMSCSKEKKMTNFFVKTPTCNFHFRLHTSSFHILMLTRMMVIQP